MEGTNPRSGPGVRRNAARVRRGARPQDRPRSRGASSKVGAAARRSATPGHVGAISRGVAHLTNSESHLGVKTTPRTAPGPTRRRSGPRQREVPGARTARRSSCTAKPFPPRPEWRVLRQPRAACCTSAPPACAGDCRPALAIDPGYAKAHLRLAKALCELNDLDGAANARAARRRSRRVPPRSSPRRRSSRDSPAMPRGRGGARAGDPRGARALRRGVANVDLRGVTLARRARRRRWSVRPRVQARARGD